MSGSSKNKKIPELNSVYFYLTEGCNLACRHCWLSPELDPDGSNKTVLPVDLFEQVLREAKPLGMTKVKLTGGEPLLHPEFDRILEILQREHLQVIIETNGTLCTKERAEAIAQSRDCFVSISLDGVDAATHEYIRNVRGTYAKTVEAIDNLVAAGITPQIVMSVMRCNVDQVEDMAHWAEKVGAGSVKYNVVQPTSRGEIIAKGVGGVSVEEYINLGRYVEKELSTSLKIPLYVDCPIAFSSLRSLAEDTFSRTCGIKGVLGVLATGYYALCGIGRHEPGLTFGKIGQDSLETVWAENPVLKRLREDLPDALEGICAECLMRYVCQGACIAQNYYRTGKLFSSHWFCVEANEKGLFPQSRKIC